MSDQATSELEIVGWSPPGARARRDIIERSQSVALVGASSNPARASNFVATYLLSSSADIDVYLVNPRETEILGQPVYPSLADLPVVPDIVDVFRRNDDLPDVARDAVASRMSLSLIDPAAACRIRTRPSFVVSCPSAALIASTVPCTSVFTITGSSRICVGLSSV